MASGNLGNAQPCLGREMPGNDVPKSNCTTKARTRDTEAMPVVLPTPPRADLLEDFFISSGL